MSLSHRPGGAQGACQRQDGLRSSGIILLERGFPIGELHSSLHALEVASRFPVGDRPLVLADLPISGAHIVVDERVAEESPRV